MLSTCVHDVRWPLILGSTLILQLPPQPSLYPCPAKVIKCIHGVYYLPSVIKVIVQDDVKMRVVLEYNNLWTAKLGRTGEVHCLV
jgi:hypothetical protein